MTLDDIRSRGVVGAGGAGFPTHVKLRSGRPEFLIANAVECEPLLHKDKELLWHHASTVIEGLRAAMAVSGAAQGVIAVKARHRDLVDRLERAVSGPVRVEPVDDFYPAGDEVTLVHLVTGRVVPPGSLPIHAGCLVLNVETLFNIAADGPVTDKWLTVAGAVEAPATVRVPVGSAFGDVLGLFRITAGRFVIRSGGLMMGALEGPADAAVTKTTAGLIVLPENHPAAAAFARYATERETERTARASCDQCSFCAELCPRYLLGYPVRPDIAMRNRMFGRAGSFHPGNAFCCECNLCTLYACPEGLDPRGAAVIEKKACRGGGEPRPAGKALPHPLLPYRRVPMSKLKRRLGIEAFRDEGPLVPADVRPGSVRLLLRPRAGRPAKPVVRPGDAVKRGDPVAVPDGEISAAVHASIEGRVADVNENFIRIERS
jgi:Na+-translocating ferredoxin:NAD+ oxidoreductase RnfC subunit